jgi:hypothetical protein
VEGTGHLQSDIIIRSRFVDDNALLSMEYIKSTKYGLLLCNPLIPNKPIVIFPENPVCHLQPIKMPAVMASLTSPSSEIYLLTQQW